MKAIMEMMLLAAVLFSQDNTWIRPSLAFVLPSGVTAAEWRLSDGYCTAFANPSNGSILWRSGVGQYSSVSHPKLDPGFYSNATLEWIPSTDSVRVIDIFNWDGGSYSAFSPLPAFFTDTTPVPRHTYDGMTYVGEQDAIYLMLGAYGRGLPPDSTEARALYLLDDTASTWKFTLSDRKWRRIPGNIRQFWKSVYTVSNYESHLRYWPEGRKLLFVNDGGSYHAEFDLLTETWANVTSAGLRAPFSLYNARSAWDSRRGLWVFRNGKNVCAYDPGTRTYTRLPDIRPDTAHGRGIAYDSRHDMYICPIHTTTATAIYSPEDSSWSEITGEVTLPDAWAAYDSLSDWVCYVNQQTVYKFRHNPESAGNTAFAGHKRPVLAIGASPNPARSTIRITACASSLSVFDCSGKRVAELAVRAGEAVWNAAGLPSGVYLVRAKIGSRLLQKSVTVLK